MPQLFFFRSDRSRSDRLVRSQVMDETGAGGSPGTCVVLNRWHVHTDSGGYFPLVVEDPLPQQVTLKVYKRYGGDYETLKTTFPSRRLSVSRSSCPASGRMTSFVVPVPSTICCGIPAIPLGRHLTCMILPYKAKTT